MSVRINCLTRFVYSKIHQTPMGNGILNLIGTVLSRIEVAEALPCLPEFKKGRSFAGRGLESFACDTSDTDKEGGRLHRCGGSSLYLDSPSLAPAHHPQVLADFH